MLPRLLWLGVAAALAVAPAGCGKRKEKRKGKTPVSTDAVRKTPQLRRKGVAHGGLIDMVALSPDGNAALSRDRGGGIRLWPSFDGEQEPFALPAGLVSSFSVAARGKGQGYTVALTDASGATQLLAVSQNGDTKELASLPPFDPVFEAHVLPGGDQVLTLHRDRSVRLLRRDGRELGRLERRRFLPQSLRVSQTGKVAVAIELLRALPQSREGALHRIEITGNSKRPLAWGAAPERFRIDNDPTQQTAALSPDGRFFAVLGRDRDGQKSRAFVHDLLRPGSRRSFGVEIPAHDTPSLGFISQTDLLVSGRSFEASYLLDLRSGRVVQRPAPPSSATGRAIAGKKHVAGFGRWLYVLDVEKSRQQYFGFESFRPSAVAFSPKSDWLAWGYERAEVYVEPFFGSGQPPTRLKGEVPERMQHLFFVDEQHVLGVDASDTILLINWTTGKHVETGIDGRILGVAYEPETKLLLLERQNSGKRIFEVDVAKGFTGPFILPDTATRSGLLGAGQSDGAVMWTVGNDGKMRRYKLHELQRGVSTEDVADRGELMPPGQLIAIDRAGNRYLFSSGRLTVGRGVRSKTIELRFDRLDPSWDGERLLVSRRADDGGSLVTLYNTATLEESWTHRLAAPANSSAWSRDGRFVALGTFSGGIVLDVSTGEPIVYRCGLGYEARGAAPKDAFSGGQGRTVCDP